ncbi:RIIa domain-containing protein 1-like [Oopsacas minuta]|uniref:RIIa domain-containing protein 1-like n=1 Tax=Oopsacas minuta TaxID=111878 RepID=A0AAV7KDD8_9METZ|nr:RIIa domain-containing protein 1-like [Oopsacas minuta]
MSLSNLEQEPSLKSPNATISVETDLSRNPAIEPRDVTVLSQDQQMLLNDVKIQNRLKNEEYIRQKPELVALVKGFMKQILLERPDNVEKFAGSFFTDSHLREKYPK